MAKYTNALFPDKINDLIDNEGNVNPLSDAASKEYVNKLMSGALQRKIVEELPVTDIDTNTIYMVLDTEGEEGNVYKEYMYIENAWELIGSTATSGTGIVEIALTYDTSFEDLVAAMEQSGAVGSKTSCFLRHTGEYIRITGQRDWKVAIHTGDIVKCYRDGNTIQIHNQFDEYSTGIINVSTTIRAATITKFLNIVPNNSNAVTDCYLVSFPGEKGYFWKEEPFNETLFTFYLRGYDMQDSIESYTDVQDYENHMNQKDHIYIKFSTKLPNINGVLVRKTWGGVTYPETNEEKFEVFASTDYNYPGTLGFDDYSYPIEKLNYGAYPFIRNDLTYDFQYAIFKGQPNHGTYLRDFDSNELTWYHGIFLGFAYGYNNSTNTSNSIVVFLDKDGNLQERAYKDEMLSYDPNYYDDDSSEQALYAKNMYLYNNAVLIQYTENIFTEPENPNPENEDENN